MHIILVSNRLATAKTLNITPRRAVFAFVAFVLLSFATSFLFSWFGVRFNLPFASELVESVQHAKDDKTEDYLRDNISSMTVKLGEMQARMMRLDSLGERLSKISGIEVPKPNVKGKDGKGGPLLLSSRPFSPDELQREILRLGESLDQRAEALTVVESQLMERRIKSSLLPTLSPIVADHIGSTFGRRLDPIAGVTALHEGIDFVADKGTRIIASAGGVVSLAEFHPQYGNMIEIDHGHEFSSRYAHLSKINVKSGQIVKRGQLIGVSGNTGRSTGPHLHFEVRFKGVAQDPARFLQHDGSLALNATGESTSGAVPVKAAPHHSGSGAAASRKTR